MSRHDDDWVEQIEETLASLGMFDEGVRAAIVREMRTALDDEAPRPRVAVLEGGRVDDLLLDDDDDDGLDDHPTADAPHGDPERRFEVFGRDEAPDLAVRVVKAPRVPRVAAPVGLEVGHLRLPADPDVWQTVLQGRGVASYRVHCDAGELHVSVDAALVARLEAGQSVDVEGVTIRVRACGEDPAMGRFTRLG